LNKIILASNSPRRKAFLEKYNIDLQIMKSDLEEKIDENEKPEQVVMSLAFQKAMDVASKISGDNIILSADTIVVFENEILGKPTSKADAKKMLNKLSGNKHKVFTGFCIMQVDKGLKVVDYAETIVHFKKIDKVMIDLYLDTEEYLDKAGSYGIQGFGELFVEKINGSYSNVVGLPIEKVYEVLYNKFNISLL